MPSAQRWAQYEQYCNIIVLFNMLYNPTILYESAIQQYSSLQYIEYYNIHLCQVTWLKIKWISRISPDLRKLKYCIDPLQPYSPRGPASAPFTCGLPEPLARFRRSSAAKFIDLLIGPLLRNYDRTTNSIYYSLYQLHLRDEGNSLCYSDHRKVAWL